MEQKQKISIYKDKRGNIELRADIANETIWATQDQIAELFNTTKQNISLHLKNIFKTGELKQNSVVKDFFTTASDGKQYKVKFYNLDAILSVGYRVNSKQATSFRQWATKTLRKYIVYGFAINKKRVSENYNQFLEAVDKVKHLLPTNGSVDTESTLELVKLFATTWFSLEAYDKSELPEKGATKKQVKLTAAELEKALAELKQELINKDEATYMFGEEKSKGNVAGIVGNVMQSFGGKDLYATAEDKAAHLLYFMVKNHPFTDGNKRSGAFSFVWFLRKARILDTTRLSPEALTALTLLVAESDPKDKDQVLGLIRLLIMK